MRKLAELIEVAFVAAAFAEEGEAGTARLIQHAPGERDEEHGEGHAPRRRPRAVR